MVSTKVSRGHPSKVSSTAAPAATSTAITSQKSSILRSRFAPSEFQLSLFASVIQSFVGQQIRIHDTITGRLRCEHTINGKATINCLDWGHNCENHSEHPPLESKKKRKRRERDNASQPDSKDVVLAFGTSDSEIQLFSPSESKIVRVLREAHTQGVRDFRFIDSGYNGKGWSVGGDGRIVQWNIQAGQPIRSLKAPTSAIVTLCPITESILCASHTAYLLDSEAKKDLRTFPASSNPIHTILASDHPGAPLSAFLTAAKAERAMNVFDVSTGKLSGVLVPEAEVVSLALSSSKGIGGSDEPNGEARNGIKTSVQSLAAVNKDGIVELFTSPFDFAQASNYSDAENIKARRKGMTRKAAAVIKLKRPEESAILTGIFNASFEGNHIIFAWTEGGVNVLFERVRWRDESTGEILLEGVHEIVKARVGAGVSATVMNGVKDMGKSHLDDSHAVVTNGLSVQIGMDPSSAIDISSAESESEYSDEEIGLEETKQPEAISNTDTQEKGDENPTPVSVPTSEDNQDVEMQDPDEQVVAGRVEDGPSVAQEEPSFGEMIRAKAQDAIDVQASFPKQDQKALVTTGEKSLQLPSGMSLGTVLTQSLRTNDVNLLESCFHVRDLRTVRATIERIDSSLAAVLLHKLAERLHGRPGRAGSLMVWIQWTLVAHGGYLAGQPEVMRKLTSLHRVIAERANSLQSLLSLKGKLDMLEAQMNLRRSMQARSKAANALDEDNEEGVIYVEGQEESESEDEAKAVMLPAKTTMKEATDAIEASESEANDSISESEEDEGDDMPTTTNGVVPNSEDDGSESEDDGLIDDEAVSTDSESDEDISADEVDHDDVSSNDSEPSSEPEDTPPAKRLAKTKLANGLSKKPR